MNHSSFQSRILIVDDHPMMRDGLTMRINSQADMHVCGEAACENEAVEMVVQTSPDLVLVDISLQSGNGIELVKRIRLLNAETKMLVVSTFQESLYAERALRAGALGYLNKQESNEIETSGAGNTITIGLPDNVIIGAGLTVTGALDVNGGW